MARSHHEDVNALLTTTGAKRWFRRARGPQLSELLPGFASTDPIVLAILEEMASTLNTELPASVNDNGTVFGNGVPADFNALLTVSGYGMDPLPIPLVDNGLFRDSLGLNKGFESKEDESLFHELLDEMFAYHKPAALPIRKEASTGFPYFTSDVEYKKMAMLKVLHNVDDYLRASLSDEKRALSEYHSQLVYAINERQQPETTKWDGRGPATPKERLVPDEAYARSGGAEGRMFPADKSVVMNGRKLDRHFAMRRRTVFGMSFVPNYLLAAVLAGCRAVYLERFAFTWKHRTHEEVSAKVGKYKFLVGSDVKNMDTTVPIYAIDAMCEGLKRHWRDDLVDLVRAMFRAPFVMPFPFRDKRIPFNHLFGGDPMDVSSFHANVGLPSGISINPDTGKLWMVFTYLAALRACGCRFDSVAGVLMGEHPDVALLDMGDDAVLMVNDEQLAQKLLTYESGYAKLQPEIPSQFLGRVFLEDSSGIVKAVPNPLTSVVNWYVPERGINSRQRALFWETGFEQRQHYYAAAPAFAEINKIVERIWLKRAGVSPTALVAVSKMRKPSIAVRNSADAQVVQNPDYLHYRVDPKDVSPEVLDMIVSVLPAADVYPHIRGLYKRTAA